MSVPHHRGAGIAAPVRTKRIKLHVRFQTASSMAFASAFI